MTFPVYIPIGPWRIHPHLFFESLSYFIGFRVYLALRRRAGDTVIVPDRWATLSCAAAGAALGARVLAWLANPQAAYDLTSVLLGGKTIVGGLIGGLVGVELVKLAMGIRRSTGDLYAPALAVAIAIGRVGCLLTGIADDTSGTPTSLPWGMDLGDGIRRHPTQIYEIVVLAAMVVPLWRLARRTMAVAAATDPAAQPGAGGVLREGDAFKAFMVGYMLLRVAVDFVKPYPAVFLGLGVLQWACVATIAWYARDIWRWTGRRSAPVRLEQRLSEP
jgi:phosphatidylglycerol:prolipoprotein diacylglycerol transferase